MKTLPVSKFKARCLGLVKEVRDTGEPIALTLRGETIAIVKAPGSEDPQRRESVSETLARLRPLLSLEDEEFVAPARVAARASALAPFPDED